MKILVLGDGLLGSELIKQMGWEFLSPQKDGIDVINDFCGFVSKVYEIMPTVIINCIGYTKTYETQRQHHWDLNYKFVVDLVDMCNDFGIKLVHVSTDYIYANSKNKKSEEDIPVHQETWYSYTKLISDAYVQVRSKDYLMFRCSFKPKPFPYEKAFVNIMGNFDYVDVLAKQMIGLIIEERTGVWNIGTEFKSVYELAIQTREVVDFSYSSQLPIIEMDLTKYKTRIRNTGISD
jgi:dTDP-4-dehydrorhamnose reductase